MTYFKMHATALPEEEQQLAREAVSWAKKLYTVKELAALIKVSPVTISRWYHWGGTPGRSNWPALKSFYQKEVRGEVR